MSETEMPLYECWCPECSEDWYPDEMSRENAIKAHNRIMHDGESVAESRPIDPEEWDI